MMREHMHFRNVSNVCSQIVASEMQTSLRLSAFCRGWLWLNADSGGPPERLFSGTEIGLPFGRRAFRCIAEREPCLANGVFIDALAKENRSRRAQKDAQIEEERGVPRIP